MSNVELLSLARPSSKAQFEKRTSPRKRAEVCEKVDDGERRNGKGCRGTGREGEINAERRARGEGGSRERGKETACYFCAPPGLHRTRCHVTGALHSVTSRWHSVIDQLEVAVNPLTTRSLAPLRYRDPLALSTNRLVGHRRGVT